MKKMCYAIMLVLSFPTCALANEMGFGFSMRNSGSMLFLPTRVSENLRVEPSLGINTSHTETSDSTFGSTSGSSRGYSLGIGLFSLSSEDESTDLYYGARLIYSRSKLENNMSTSFSRGKGEAYSISPTIGFEYHIGRSVTLGAEAGVYYTRQRDETAYSTGATGSVTTRHYILQGTRSDIIIRYYFK